MQARDSVAVVVDLPNLIARARRAGASRRRDLAEAAVTLAASAVAVRLLPFRRAISIGCVPLADQPATPAAMSEATSALSRLAGLVPWRSVCIDQSIALQRMLRRRGIDARLHYGIAHDPALALAAHVWVMVGDRIVIGGEEAPKFAEVAVFPQ